MEDFNNLKREYLKVKARNKVLTVRNEKMRLLAGEVQKLGATPIIYVDSGNVPTGDVGFSECARLCGTYSGKIQKVLISNGIIRKNGKLWIVNEPYQDKGWFVYHYGVFDNYTRFFLKVTETGVAVIQRYLAEYAPTRKYNRKKKE